MEKEEAMSRQLLETSKPFVRFGKELTLNPVIRSTTGLESITVHEEQDIFIVGYPKSGNTWFQNLASGIIYGVNPQYTPEALIRELVPDVHKKRYYRRFSTPMFFKSHALPRPEYRRVVYLLRDGRDAMVSYYHYLTGWRGRNVDFWEMVKNGEGLICKWHDHVNAWLSNPYDAEILTIKYEDLKLQTVHELQRFCDFTGTDRDNSWLEQVAENAVFNKMQNKEKSGKYFDDPNPANDNLFFRRGVVGSYKDEMPTDILALFLNDSQETLERCGYSLDDFGVANEE
ncbi:MAG: sulfotransferase domain-containing protein [Candidatus Promineifilaceae bacterium]|nr:sulfotransferase domain-containing protein [Candidatus Promineifilaceae bacterium]